MLPLKRTHSCQEHAVQDMQLQHTILPHFKQQKTLPTVEARCSLLLQCQVQYSSCSPLLKPNQFAALMAKREPPMHRLMSVIRGYHISVSRADGPGKRLKSS